MNYFGRNRRFAPIYRAEIDDRSLHTDRSCCISQYNESGNSLFLIFAFFEALMYPTIASVTQHLLYSKRQKPSAERQSQLGGCNYE